MKRVQIVLLIISLMLVLGVGCGWIAATGDSVEAVGDGVGHAVEGTGDAIGRAANETERKVSGN